MQSEPSWLALVMLTWSNVCHTLSTRRQSVALWLDAEPLTIR